MRGASDMVGELTIVAGSEVVGGIETDGVSDEMVGGSFSSAEISLSLMKSSFLALLLALRFMRCIW